MVNNDKRLWEILVPFNDNHGKKFPIEHHKRWDSFVRGIAGGLSVFRTAKGQWVHEDEVFTDRMIPVRIMCTEKQIDTIMHYTLTFYDQKAIFCYLVSENVKVLHAK